MRLVYIAGPFRASSAWGIEQNIRTAEELALEVWRAGFVAICPHMNTWHFQGTLPDDTWLKGDIEILRRCDAVLLVPGWEHSRGALKEVEAAVAASIPVFESLSALIAHSQQ